MQVDLLRAISSLTDALDFVGVDEIHHGKRVALMAAAVATELGWNGDQVRDIMYAGMLHDCGVSRAVEHRQITETLEWDGAEQHCLRGEQYLKACAPLARFADVVRWHHTRWEALLALPLSDELRLQSNLIFLVDRADTLLVPYVTAQSLKDDILWEYPQLVARLADLRNSLFSPELVDAFARAAQRESFWLCLDSSYIEEEIGERLGAGDGGRLGMADALALAGLFARVTDAKSSYTLEHSTRVAAIARYLGERSGLSGEPLDQLEIAGLLHDLGKLRVPEEILDKAAPLTAQERAFVMRHSYDTGRLLKKVFPGQPIADWASKHHENLLGTGYPEHCRGANIPHEARLIAIADIFQAMAQERPYRARLGAAQVMAHLDALQAAGRIDGETVALLHRHRDACYALATGQGDV